MEMGGRDRWLSLCAANAAILGATCTPNDGTQADCADANAICPSTGTAVCTCKTGYTAYGTTCGKCTLHCTFTEIL